jgi:hypothetical protein
MKKTLLFTIILQFLFFSVHCQKKTTTIDTLKQNLILLNQKVEKSTKTITTLENQISKSKETIAILENRISQSSDTISNQNGIIGSFGVIYTILTIFFGIIGLLVPIVTYYFGIKPSRDQIKNLESNFDKRLEEYLKLSKQQEIDTAIDRLSGDSAELKQNAITYLSLTQHEGLSDIQYFKLYKIITSDGLDSAYKYSLAYVLTGKKNEYATEYSKNILQAKKLYNEYIPARYFGMIGVTDYIEEFTNYLKSFPEKNDVFMRIISHMKTISLNSVLELFNTPEIIDLFNGNDLKNFKANNFNSSFEKGFEEDKVKETKLYKIVFA